MLHHYDWSESSLILDLFTREQGRIAVAAKGAKRPFSQLRSVLLPFQRLQVSLGRQPPGDDTREVHTLRAADWAGGHPMLTGAALFSGFYLNELLMKLLARHDPHAALFDAYAGTVAALAAGRRGRHAGGAARLRAGAAARDRPAARPRHRDRVASAGARRSALPRAGRRRRRRDRTTRTRRPSAARRSPPSRWRSRADLASLQQVAAGALAELRPLLRAQLHYHLGTSQLRTRQVMIEAQALDR